MIETRQDDNTVHNRRGVGAIAARLLWKEANQAWPWYLFGTLVASAAIPWMQPERMVGWKGQVCDYPWVLVSLAMTVRGALLAAERNRQSYAVTHFAMNPEWMPAFAFGINLLGVLLLGLAIGRGEAVYRDPLLMVPITLYFMLAFLLGYVVAFIFGKSYAGIVAGIPLLMFLYPMLAGFVRAKSVSYGYINSSNEWKWLIYCLSGIVIALIFLPFSARLPLLLRRSVMALFIVLCLVVPSFPLGRFIGYDRNIEYDLITNQHLAASDGARVVKFIRQERPVPYYDLQYADYRRQREVQQRVTTPYLLLGFDSQDSVLLIGQRLREGRMSVVRWRLAGNRMKTLFTFRIRRKAIYAALRYDQSRRVSLRPDGAYAALQLPSWLEDRVADLWLLDLRQQHAQLIAVGDRAESLAWQDNRLILGSPTPMQISLTTRTKSPFSIIPQEAWP